MTLGFSLARPPRPFGTKGWAAVWLVPPSLFPALQQVYHCNFYNIFTPGLVSSLVQYSTVQFSIPILYSLMIPSGEKYVILVFCGHPAILGLNCDWFFLLINSGGDFQIFDRQCYDLTSLFS